MRTRLARTHMQHAPPTLFPGCPQLTRSFLSPNLHIAVCRLPRQEALRGPAARDKDFWMERFLRKPKARIQGNLVRNIDMTYALHTEVTERALVNARVNHGCESSYGMLTMDEDAIADPDERDAVGDMRQLLRQGAAITRGVTTPKCGLMPDDARAVVDSVCSALAPRPVRRVLGELTDILRWVAVTAHHSARAPGCLLRSVASPTNLRRKQSSFATVRQSALIPLDSDQRGAANQAPPRGVAVVYCHAFLHLARLGGRGAPPTEEEAGFALFRAADSWAGDYALVEVPPAQRRSVFVGTPTRSCHSVNRAVRLADLCMVPLADIRQQLILVSEGAFERSRNTLRFLEFFADVDL